MLDENEIARRRLLAANTRRAPDSTACPHLRRDAGPAAS